MKTADELRQKRKKVYDDMSAVADAAADGRQAEFDKLEGQYNELDAQVRRFDQLHDLERRQQGQQLTGTGDDHFDAELRSRYSLTRAVAGAAGLKVDDAFEREAGKEAARRAGVTPRGDVYVPWAGLETRVTLAGGNGGTLVPSDTVAFIDLLRSKMITRMLGATFLTGLVGNVVLNRQTASVGAQWVNENEPLNFTDPAFDAVTMTPKTIGSITEWSRLMALQSSPDIETLNRNDMAAVLARGLDHAALFGSGTGAEPRGVYNDPDIPTVVMTSPPTWAQVLAYTSYIEANDIEGSGWAMHPRARALLRATVKATGEGAGFLMEDAKTLAGYPVAMTSTVPTNLGVGEDQGGIVFGRFSDLCIGTWGDGFDILVNPYATESYRRGNIQIRAMLTADVAVRHPESFVRGSVVLP